MKYKWFSILEAKIKQIFYIKYQSKMHAELCLNPDETRFWISITSASIQGTSHFACLPWTPEHWNKTGTWWTFSSVLFTGWIRAVCTAQNACFPAFLLLFPSVHKSRDTSCLSSQVLHIPILASRFRYLSLPTNSRIDAQIYIYTYIYIRGFTIGMGILVKNWKQSKCLLLGE